MNEKLELMKWLYENGVEPRMCAYIGEKYPLLYDMRDPPAKMVDGKFVEPFDKEVVPYHPLEQVLEELPESLKNFDLILSKLSDCIGYYEEDPHGGWGNWLLCEDIAEQDTHLAALRLLKRVKEGEKE